MPRYFLEIMYDGTAFHGSQLQGDIPTVQREINQALKTLLREECVSFGASRTDEGVHALGNFYHFDTEQELHPHFHYKMNAILPLTVSVKKIFLATDKEMNARFDALSRSYRYKIYFHKNPFYHHRAYYFPYKMNRSVLDETAAILKEYTSFESFSKRNTQSKTFNCTIIESYWEEVEDQLHYVVEANRFLRGMVRAMVGTQLQAAREKISVDEFRKIVEAGNCTLADFSVPGFGLYLEEIKYPEGSLTELFLR